METPTRVHGNFSLGVWVSDRINSIGIYKNMKCFKVPEMVRIDLDFRLGPETGKEIKQP